VDRFREAIRSRYQERFHIDPPIFRCVPSEGAGEQPT
jgi:hypothetical protein